MRDVAVFEIEFVRGDVFEPLRAEIHGERAGYFREDARAVKSCLLLSSLTVVYTSRLVAEREREGFCSRKKREEKRRNILNTHVEFLVVGFVNSANAMVPLLSFFTELIALRYYYFCAFLLF